ncbi:MAG: cytochrome c oxidase subunit II [Alphaproteobacteria bacterium]|nr:cytochrome c oxidase subunit II [Alphaproteobacteria bacterium]
MRLRWTSAVLSPLGCAGCVGWQSAMDPQGPQAEHLHRLIWLFTGVAAVIWLLVMLSLALAIWRRRDRSDEPVVPTNAARERRSAVVVFMAVGATVGVIAGLTLASYLATRQVSEASAEPLKIRVQGYQWWWQVSYLDPAAARQITTANEIHIPVGRPVNIELAAADVIHSFWVPNLAGKMDLIPGRDNRLEFTVARPGQYRGQCAEFCGLQHAHMALLVMAESEADFETWQNAQLAPSAAPDSDERRSGRQIVTGKACGACHTVRGTEAAGTIGPDLTHVASRAYIAAGVLPTTRGSLAAWVADPQTIKPGNNMPMVPLTADELRAVSAYLSALK